MLIDDQQTMTRPILLHSKSAITVQTLRKQYSRRYKGVIELVPTDYGFYVINHIPVESYLEGVLNAEISTKWQIEVVKAQTVISRTFALYQKEKRENNIWHVSSGLSDQVYKGSDIVDQRGLYAIRQTRGIVVTYKDKLAQTFYHSNCGGTTEDAGALWKVSFPYLIVKQVPFGKSDPRFRWEATLSNRKIEAIFKNLGYRGGKIKNLSISEYNPSGRVKKLVVNNSPKMEFLAKDFRRKAGYKQIQSLLFQVVRVPGGFYFKGSGNGHGVGLSQWSAKEMAEKGYLYHEILHFFYTGTKHILTHMDYIIYFHTCNQLIFSIELVNQG